VSGEGDQDSEEERLVALLLRALGGSAVDFTNTFLVLGKLQTVRQDGEDGQAVLAGIESLDEEELLARAGLLPLLEHARGVYLKGKEEDIAAGNARLACHASLYRFLT
jgi:hypothetical protein